MSSKTRKKKFKQVFKEQIKIPEKKEEPLKIIDKDKDEGFSVKMFSLGKILIIIPLIILFISIFLIGLKYSQTGEFINRGVSLKGGTTFTISSENIEYDLIRDKISNRFPYLEIDARTLTEGTRQIGISLETDAIDDNDVNGILLILREEYDLTQSDYSVERMGSSLGMSFFRQTMRALVLAFIFMAIVVFIYFRNFVPSITVVLATFSNIMITVAIVNLLGIKLSTAGIAAFLMLIGYSVDTNIVLTTKILKSKEGSFYDRFNKAFKTGIMMTITTLIVVISSYFIAESDVIKQIMLIIAIGLFVDIMNTWVQNASILKLYFDKKMKN
jgi:preprotein translocase subunit SecF